jgi:RimJ/RimL family protein N-acetyltransferase
VALVKLSDPAIVRPLFDELAYNLAIDSITGGITQGIALADKEEDPELALLWNLMDTLILTGSPEDAAIVQELNWLLKAAVFPNARQRYIPSITLHFSPSGWRQQEKILFAGITVTYAYRRYYQFIDQNTAWMSQVPPGGQVRPIDAELIAQESLGNISEVRGWLSSFWSSLESFENHGFGFCLIIDDSIVSWCLTVYASGRYVELGLATVPEYRNQGYATIVGGACIDYCLRSDKLPQWHTFEDNRPSITVAEKLGFGLPQTYPVCRLLVNES